jgi:hypothetical protein
MSNQATKEKAHPFEIAGMGVGPYVWAGFYEMPNVAEDSAANFACGNPYTDAPKLKAGLGTCACCGMAIVNVCIVKDANGDLWGVGSDCVEKCDDPSLGDKAKIEIARKQRRQRQARADKQREARRVEFGAKIATDSRALPGETNAQLQARLNSEWQAQQQAAKLAQEARAAQLADILPHLSGNDFYTSLGNQLRIGPLTERQAHYALKAVFGRGHNRDAGELMKRLTS